MYKYVDFPHVHLPPFIASKLAVKNDTLVDLTRLSVFPSALHHPL